MTDSKSEKQVYTGYCGLCYEDFDVREVINGIQADMELSGESEAAQKLAKSALWKEQEKKMLRVSVTMKDGVVIDASIEFDEEE